MCHFGLAGASWDEQLPDEFPAARYAGFLEDRIHMILDGVSGNVQRGGQLLGGKSFCAKHAAEAGAASRYCEADEARGAAAAGIA